MSENSPVAQEGLRGPEGTIIDQSPGLKTTELGTSSTDQTKKVEDTTVKATESIDKKVEAKDGKSLLNQDDKKPELVGAPEKYEPFKAPDGFVITPEATEALNGLFKEAGVSQTSAQKLIDYIAPQLMEAVQAPYNQFQQERQGWQKDVMEKYGTRLPEVKTTVSRALDSLGNPKLVDAFKAAMDYTGAGDNPAFIDVIYELGKRVSEGTHVKGNGPSKLGQTSTARPLTAAQAMYPNLPSADAK